MEYNVDTDQPQKSRSSGRITMDSLTASLEWFKKEHHGKTWESLTNEREANLSAIDAAYKVSQSEDDLLELGHS